MYEITLTEFDLPSIMNSGQVSPLKMGGKEAFCFPVQKKPLTDSGENISI